MYIYPQTHTYTYLPHFLFTHAHSSFLPPSFSLLKKTPLQNSSWQKGEAVSVLCQCHQHFRPAGLLKKVLWPCFFSPQLEGPARRDLGTAQPCPRDSGTKGIGQQCPHWGLEIAAFQLCLVSPGCRPQPHRTWWERRLAAVAACRGAGLWGRSNLVFLLHSTTFPSPNSVVLLL